MINVVSLTTCYKLPTAGFLSFFVLMVGDKSIIVVDFLFSMKSWCSYYGHGLFRDRHRSLVSLRKNITQGVAPRSQLCTLCRQSILRSSQNDKNKLLVFRYLALSFVLGFLLFNCGRISTFLGFRW